jgi:hypothetical protein
MEFVAGPIVAVTVASPKYVADGVNTVDAAPLSVSATKGAT